ncbi:RHS repeat-associated core domain-containing protein [Streptosporangium saharense]|uniref:RHS repeat-associated core domain-containing protein n=1 Tax=Streptosporangium saharense TaxID=1706840 RepID=UPI003682F377
MDSPLLVRSTAPLRRRPSLERFLAAGLTVALITTMAQPAQASPSPQNPQPKRSQTKIVTERPDRVSAALSARLQRSRVLIADETTESSLTYANPDGTLTVETVSGAARVKQNDRWTPVDTALIEVSGVLRPRAAKAGVELSAGGQGRPLAKMSRENGTSFALTWPTALPKPIVKDNVATYPDAAGQGADLVVTALPTGFRHDVVLRTRPTGPVEFKIPVAAKGLTLTDKDRDGLALTDAKGKIVASAPEPFMYDSTTGEAPKLAGAVTPEAKIDTRVVKENGQQVLVLKPDEKFLSDPKTVYPVTVDPTTTLGAQTDVTVTGMFPNNPNASADYFGPGSSWHDEFGVPTRHNSYGLVKFDLTSLTGQSGIMVSDAKLELYGYGDSSCETNQGVTVQQVTGSWNQNVTYNTRPTTTATGQQTVLDPNDCGTGSAERSWTWPITSIVQGWMTGTANNGLMLRTKYEWTSGTLYYGAAFHASEKTGTNAHPPKLIVTYGSTPSTGTVRAAPIVVTKAITETNTTTPRLFAELKDPDGGLLRGEFQVERNPDVPVYDGGGTGSLWSGSVDNVQAGDNAAVTIPANTLTDNTALRWRVRAFDGTEYSPWSAWSALHVDTTKPDVAVTCPSAPAGQWTTNTSVQCTLSTTSPDAMALLWGLDDPATPNVEDNGKVQTPVTSKSITLNDLPSGWHTLYVKSRDKAHNTSTVATYAFGSGVGGLTKPVTGDRTQQAITLGSSAPTTRTAVRYEYRTDLTTGTWTALPTADVTVPGSATPIASWPQTRTDTAQNFTDLTWNLAKTLQDQGRADGPVEIRACFSGGAAEACSTATTVTLDRSAFGGSYATAKLGPGEVALNTGDYSLPAFDAEIFGLSVGRTYTTLKPTTTVTAGPTGIFGPGWKAAFPAGSSDASVYQLNNGASSDSLTLVGPSGETLTYTRSPDGTYKGIGDAADGSKIVVDSATQVTHHDSAGIKTSYTMSGGSWLIAKTEDDAQESTFTYTRDAQGRVTRMTAPVPTGVTCGPSLVAGCRALELTYATSTTATGTGSGWGDYNGLIKQISLTAYDPVISAMKTVPMVTYAYDSTGHLRTATNAAAGLTTTYYYNAQGRVSQVTPPGLAPWRMEYDSQGRIANVQREGGAVDPTEAVAYDIPIGGAAAPIDLTVAETGKWGQTSDLPRIGVATFPASHVPTRIGNGAYQPSAEELKDGTLTYLDVNGRAVNTAGYGAGGWQIATSRYDDKGNTVWQLASGNRAQALNPNANTDAYAAARPTSADRANLLASTSTYNADSDLLGREGPAHQIKLTSGAYASVRERTALTYDEGKPQAGVVYHLVTTTKSEPVVLDGTAIPSAGDTRTAKTGYDPIVGGDPSGWDLRLVTSSAVTVDGQADIVRKTRYNAKGQVIEERMPQSNGADAGTTITTYYTADSTGPVECRKSEWAGLVCQRGPKAQPTSGKPLPITRTTAYNHFGLPTTTTETAGTAVRTTTTRYDTAGRPIGVKTEVSPQAEGGVPLPEATTTYDPATGLITGTTAGTASTATGYDDFGRPVSYTDADSNTSTATYTVDGKVATSSDGKGTTTYTYDGIDYWGRAEHRGLLTKIDTPGVGAFQGVYGEDSQLIQQAYPNWLTAEYRYDNAGNNIGLTYTKDQNRWLGFTNTLGANNTTVQATSPASLQDYAYDTAGRLTKVADIYNQRCTTRTYAFTPNTNRSGLSAHGPAVGGRCTTDGNPVSTSYTYDEADRIITSGYVYDAFGRTTTIPSTHVFGGAELTVGYHANDMVASMQQAGVSRTFALDPEGRIRSTTQTGGTRPGSMVNHYNGPSDNPVWITEADGTWSRNLKTIAGALGAIQRSNGQVTLQLADLNDSIVATADASMLSTGIDAYFEQGEYGAPRPENVTTPTRYGWLGKHQRSSDATGGIILMGARLYNPVTGRFLQVDPVIGGSSNAYEYATQDPINNFDLDGRKKKPKKAATNSNSPNTSTRFCDKYYWGTNCYGYLTPKDAQSVLRKYKDARDVSIGCGMIGAVALLTFVGAAVVVGCGVSFIGFALQINRLEEAIANSNGKGVGYSCDYSNVPWVNSGCAYSPWGTWKSRSPV